MDTVEKRGTERVATSAEGHETAKIEELEEVGTPNDGSIDPANELKGPRLVLLHTGLCLCTLLTGLVGTLAPYSSPSRSFVITTFLTSHAFRIST
jgi:hypothetical protein